MSRVEWQLPINEDRHVEHMVHHKSKIHAFVNGESLCRKYELPPNFYETTDVKEEDIMRNNDLACKECLSKLDVI